MLKILFAVATVLVVFVLSLMLLFSISMIPAMLFAWLITKFFIVPYTFWQISIAIAIILCLFSKGVNIKK